MYIFRRTLDYAYPVTAADLDGLGVECITIKELLDEFEPPVADDDGLIRI